MSDPKDRAYLQDMREFAMQVLNYLQAKSHADFMGDRLLRDAVAYNPAHTASSFPSPSRMWNSR